MTTVMSDQELSLLSINEGQVTWTKEQKAALIDVLRVRHASEADLAVFFHQCRRTQLDPFLRQLYMIARQEWDSDAQAKVWRQTFQTGIDGFRVIGHRRAKQLGTELSYEDTVYFDGEGKAYEVWVDETKPPAAVRVTVTLGNSRYPFTARYSDYVPLTDEYEPDKWENGKKIKGKKTGNKVPSGMWKTRPTGQLEKCAEAGALRRACPQDLSGIYEFSEMERQHNTDEPITTLVDDGAATSRTNKPAGKKERNWIYQIQRAKDRTTLRALWNEAKDAGIIGRRDISDAFDARSAKLEAEQPVQPEPVSSEPAPPGPGQDVPADEVPVEPSTAVDEPGDDPWAGTMPGAQ